MDFPSPHANSSCRHERAEAVGGKVAEKINARGICGQFSSLSLEDQQFVIDRVREQRPGLHENPFYILKFRSMPDARESTCNLLPDRDRLPPFGVWLRKSSLNELPVMVVTDSIMQDLDVERRGRLQK